jgi:universal stress protein E
MELRRILVAIKPWQRGLPLAATHARALAQSVGAEIKLVSTVFDAGVAASFDRDERGARVAEERAISAARADLERLAASMRDWGARVSTKAVWGVPAYDAILSVVEDWHPDLLVVGVHEPDKLHTRFTDTDWQLMRRAPCPLLLVKGGTFAGYRTIVAAVDPLHAHDEPDGLDQDVLDAGRCFARTFDSSLRAVYAYPGASAFELASAVEVSPGVLYGAENVPALHRRAVNELVEQYGVADSEVDLVEGIPAEVVIDTVAERNAELVVVGSPQRRGILAALVGSTAESVAASVGCDVLVVPTRPPAVRRRPSKVG